MKKRIWICVCLLSLVLMLTLTGCSPNITITEDMVNAAIGSNVEVKGNEYSISSVEIYNEEYNKGEKIADISVTVNAENEMATATANTVLKFSYDKEQKAMVYDESASAEPEYIIKPKQGVSEEVALEDLYINPLNPANENTWFVDKRVENLPDGISRVTAVRAQGGEYNYMRSEVVRTYEFNEETLDWDLQSEEESTPEASWDLVGEWEVIDDFAPKMGRPGYTVRIKVLEATENTAHIQLLSTEGNVLADKNFTFNPKNDRLDFEFDHPYIQDSVFSVVFMYNRVLGITRTERDLDVWILNWENWGEPIEHSSLNQE